VIATYPQEKIFQEIAFVAYYFHWPVEQILNMEHRDRVMWCSEISQINKTLNDSSENH